MKKTLGLFLAVAICLSGRLQASDKETMNEEMQEMMSKMKEFGTPGLEHAVLKSLEGNWIVNGRSWMKPGDKPHETVSKSKIIWILDGHFLKQEFKGEMMGEPFEGIGFYGYDKMRKEYQSFWMDNMSTGIFHSTGRYDVATKTLKDSGTFSCPATGETDTPFRSEWKIVNDNKNIFSMYTLDPSGKEFKSMELVYKRLK